MGCGRALPVADLSRVLFICVWGDTGPRGSEAWPWTRARAREPSMEPRRATHANLDVCARRRVAHEIECRSKTNRKGFEVCRVVSDAVYPVHSTRSVHGHSAHAHEHVTITSSRHVARAGVAAGGVPTHDNPPPSTRRGATAQRATGHSTTSETDALSPPNSAALGRSVASQSAALTQPTPHPPTNPYTKCSPLRAALSLSRRSLHSLTASRETRMPETLRPARDA